MGTHTCVDKLPWDGSKLAYNQGYTHTHTHTHTSQLNTAGKYHVHETHRYQKGTMLKFVQCSPSNSRRLYSVSRLICVGDFDCGRSGTCVVTCLQINVTFVLTGSFPTAPLQGSFRCTSRPLRGETITHAVPPPFQIEFLLRLTRCSMGFGAVCHEMTVQCNILVGERGLTIVTRLTWAVS